MAESAKTCAACGASCFLGAEVCYKCQARFIDVVPELPPLPLRRKPGRAVVLSLLFCSGVALWRVYVYYSDMQSHNSSFSWPDALAFATFPLIVVGIAAYVLSNQRAVAALQAQDRLQQETRERAGLSRSGAFPIQQETQGGSGTRTEEGQG